MTLIIDMASGTRCDDTTLSHTAEDGATGSRLEAPAPEAGPGLQAIIATRAQAPGMPATLRTSDLERFLDRMD
jgi:hypothetical protein